MGIPFVIPAKAGIQILRDHAALFRMDAGFRRHDKWVARRLSS
jgi:hypothetical protein